MNYKIIFVCCLFGLVLAACDPEPYVEHDLQFKKISDNCEGAGSTFRLISNIGGERYEFSKCLAADFTYGQLTSARQGDTVLIRFQQPGPGKPRALYSITLDIDAYPRYQYISIDGETYTIVQSGY